jgi:hypothetical protein
MKMLMIVVMLCCPLVVSAQFKSQADQPSAAQSLVRPGPSISNFLGLLNPENFAMRHNLSYSYLSSDGAGLSVASYTNSMFYKIADPLNVRFDLTLKGSPFGASTPYQSTLNGLFLNRAELNYRPWEKFFIKVQYQHLPANYFGYYNPWYNPFSSNRLGDE